MEYAKSWRERSETFSLQLYFCTFASARVTQISKAMQITKIRTVANIKKELFDFLFNNGIHLVHGLRANMKNKLMPMRERILLRKMYVIECIDELLKNKACLVHSRHSSVLNFIMNICSAFTACLVLAKVDTFMNNKKCVKQCERVQQSTARSSN